VTPLRPALETFVRQAQADAGHALAGQALQRPSQERLSWLAAQPRGLECSTLAALLDHAHELAEDDPCETVELSALVLDVIEDRRAARPGDNVCALVYGRAWQELGYGLQRTGHNLDALHAYREASAIFARGPIMIPELATAKCGEAFVRHDVDESEAALEVLADARSVFERHNQAAGVMCSLVFEGIIHFDLERCAAAEAVFEDALRLAERLPDRKAAAFLHVHLGWCALDRGDRAATLSHFSHAIASGVPAARRRVAWGMARILIEDGAYDRGIAALEAAAQEMAEAGLVVDAALVRLDRAEAFVLTGDHERAASIGYGVAREFAAAGMFRPAMRAYELLRRVNAAGLGELT
jgi:tetratricopeptide (TPR) repeat protein